MSEHIAIVGAGLGGLATAIRLAVAGDRVTLIERNAQPGGKLNLWQAGGFSFDTGPSLLTLPQVLADLVAVAGRRLEEMLTLLPLDPAHRYHWPDGSSLDVTPRLDALLRGIERLSPGEAPAVMRLLAHSASLYASAGEPFLQADRDHLPGLVATARATPGFRVRDVPRLADPRTLHGYVASHLRDPRLVQLFDRYATYNGSSPYRTPAAYALVPWVEFGYGAWYPQGGMYEIARQLTRLATDLGVTLLTSTPVEQIMVRRGQAVGLLLPGGDRLMADRVVVNADAHTARRALLPPAFGHDAVDAQALSTSALLLLLGTGRPFPQLAHHTIFFSRDYRAEFDDLFQRQRPPAEPTIYVCASSRTDPSQAPAGQENLFVMVNVPALQPEHDWAAWAGPYRDQILTTLEARGLVGLREAIVVERCLTPTDLAAQSGAYRGALYGLAAHGPLAALRRPSNRDRRVGRLYYVGGTTHPGGGIPLVLRSGQIMARLIAEDQRHAR